MLSVWHSQQVGCVTCISCSKYFFKFFFSCWLSLEGGLLYAFVGPAAVIVLVSRSNSFKEVILLFYTYCVKLAFKSKSCSWPWGFVLLLSLPHAHVSMQMHPGCPQQNDKLSTLLLEFINVSSKTLKYIPTDKSFLETQRQPCSHISHSFQCFQSTSHFTQCILG